MTRSSTTMTNTTSPWMNPTRLPDGHRLFQATLPYRHPAMGKVPLKPLFDERGLWAIADDSGDYPADTEDGVLWLDFSRDLMAGAPAREDNPAHVPSIPLLDPHSTHSSTVT